MKDCWVVIPARNEEGHIAAVVKGVRAQRCRCVVVDDGSTDRTGQMARDAGAVVLRHVLNLGKGAAMKTGAEFVARKGGRAIVFIDGDGQHDPAELPLFLAELNAGAQIVFGSRRIKKSMPFERRLGNLLYRAVISAVYNVRLSDPLSGYRAMMIEAYRKVRWESTDYSVEGEIIARAGKEMLPYKEITIRTIYHSRFKGMALHDGLKAVVKLVWWRMTH